MDTSETRPSDNVALTQQSKRTSSDVNLAEECPARGGSGLVMCPVSGGPGLTKRTCVYVSSLIIIGIIIAVCAVIIHKETIVGSHLDVLYMNKTYTSCTDITQCSCTGCSTHKCTDLIRMNQTGPCCGSSCKVGCGRSCTRSIFQYCQVEHGQCLVMRSVLLYDGDRVHLDKDCVDSIECSRYVDERTSGSRVYLRHRRAYRDFTLEKRSKTKSWYTAVVFLAAFIWWSAYTLLQSVQL